MELKDNPGGDPSLQGDSPCNSTDNLEDTALVRLVDAPNTDHTEGEHGHARQPLEQSHHFGRNIRLAMACMDGAQRLQRLKAIKAKAESRRIDGHDVNGLDVNAKLAAPVVSATQSPKDMKHLRSELHRISAELDTQRATLIDLLVQFDAQDGWVASGSKSCAHWANANLGIAASTAYTFLQVGRDLQELPLISSLFRGGELSWSKVKLLSKVADVHTERDWHTSALTPQ